MHDRKTESEPSRAGRPPLGTRARSRRLGIGGKLLLAFTAIAALTVAATVIAWVLFANFRENLAIIAEESLPEIAASFRLAEQSAQVAASLHEVMEARSRVELGEVKQTLDDRIGEIDTLTDTHRRHDDDSAEAVLALDAMGRALRENVKGLELAVADSLAATHTRATLLNTLSTAHIHFLETVNPIIESTHDEIIAATRLSVADGTARIASLVDESVEALRAVMQLQANVNLLTAVLQQVANTTDPGVLSDRRFAIVAPIADINNQFVQVAETEGGGGFVEAARRIVDLAIGEANIFALRKAVLDSTPSQGDAVQERLSKRLIELNQAHASFLALSGQAVDSVNFQVLEAATNASREGQSIVRDTESGIQELETLLYLHSETNQLFGLLNEAGRAVYSDDIDILRFRYQVLGDQIRSRLVTYESNSPHPAVREHIENILAFGQGDRSILSSRLTELEARARAASISADSEELASRMSLTAKRLVESAEASSEAAESSTRHAMARGELLLIVVAALSLAAALLIAWRYVFRGIVGRLTSLSSSMLAIAEGDLDTEIVFSGSNDEITDMRSTLTVFREDAVKRRQAEEALRESEERMRMILATSPIGVAIARADDGTLTYANQRMAEQFGAGEETILGSHATSFYSDADERARLIDRVAADGFVKDAEVRARRVDASEFWALVSMFPMEYGGEAARLAWFYDITDRKRAETEVREARDRAERALSDLRSAQERLIQTEKMASLGQLTAGVAHEIKNPLNFIKNFAEVSAELLEELKGSLQTTLDRLGGEERDNALDLIATLDEMLGKIEDHGKRADGIVQSMLSHAREGPSSSRPTDLNALIVESLELAYHAARAEDQSFNIELVRDLDPEVGELELYPADIMRVFLNLINNALYATHERMSNGGDVGYAPTLAVSTRCKDGAVEVRIRDNGTGVPKAVLDKVFNPFFTTKPTGEGTGLGLSLSYETVVKMHNGWIDVESVEGEFTEFIVTLPRELSGRESEGEA